MGKKFASYIFKKKKKKPTTHVLPPPLRPGVCTHIRRLHRLLGMRRRGPPATDRRPPQDFPPSLPPAPCCWNGHDGHEEPAAGFSQGRRGTTTTATSPAKKPTEESQRKSGRGRHAPVPERLQHGDHILGQESVPDALAGPCPAHDLASISDVLAAGPFFSAQDAAQVPDTLPAGPRHEPVTQVPDTLPAGARP